jgi:hypothetical protein
MADTSIQVECILNKDDEVLPYAYFHPEHEGKLTWICGDDAQGKITSVFCMDLGTEKDKKCQYVENIEQAKFIRDELIRNGWQKIKPPEISVKMPDGEQRPLNRKEKRYLKRKIDKMNKQNPFS